MSPPLLFYRFNHFLHNIGMKRLAKVLSRLNRLIFGTWIPASAVLGKGVKVGYWGLGIVIHSNTIIGNYCSIGQNVTIGRNLGDRSVPRIGKYVYVGSGSVIFGEIIIGDNVIIGANTTVNKSIPANTIVGGNPFKVIGNTNGKTYLEIDKQLHENS